MLKSKKCAKQKALPKLGTACAYTLKRWKELCEYCNDGELQIDNNIVERSIRPVAVGRKNWLFSGSEDEAGFATLLPDAYAMKLGIE